MDAGGDGKAIGSCSEDAGGRICMDGACGLEDLSKKAANFPSKLCHLAHSDAEVKSVYFILLKNSTSMMCTSATLIPETSAQVLFV